MRRDRLTFGMMMGVPLMQLLLFGYAINTDPKNLPAVAVVGENSIFARSLLSRHGEVPAISASTAPPVDEATPIGCCAGARCNSPIHIPPHFADDLVRGRMPGLAGGSRCHRSGRHRQCRLRPAGPGRDGPHPRPQRAARLTCKATQRPSRCACRSATTPKASRQYNIVPGLMGVVLTMTMVMMTSLAVTRERERGTMENLLAMPVQPMEVMLGKILPYIVVGYVQVADHRRGGAVICSRCPPDGLADHSSSVAAIIFIAANLAVGFTFSTLSTNQLQAMQMSTFFFLPSLLLSGFMFPFRGMPVWAQVIGEVLPLTHFLRIVRGILLKGNGWDDIWPDLWPIFAFLAAGRGPGPAALPPDLGLNAILLNV